MTGTLSTSAVEQPLIGQLGLEPQVLAEVEHAAQLTRRSPAAFAKWAVAAAAHTVLLADAADRYRSGQGSLGEIAEQAGVAVEELMDILSRPGGVASAHQGEPAMLIASFESVAGTVAGTELLRLAHESLPGGAGRASE